MPFVSRFSLCLVLAVACVPALFAAKAAPAEQIYKGAIVMDATTGRVLFEDKADIISPPASVTKLMTYLVVNDLIKDGTLSLQTPVTVTAADSKIGGTQVWLKQGEVFPVEELLYALMIQSANDAAYALAFERIVVPVLERFEPELVLVSAGFDAHARDPLADMALSAEAFRAMAGALARVARTSAGGRVGIFLEGGYDLAALEASLVATIEGALGVGAGAPASSPTAAARTALDPTHVADVARAASAAAAHHRI